MYVTTSSQSLVLDGMAAQSTPSASVHETVTCSDQKGECQLRQEPLSSISFHFLTSTKQAFGGGVGGIVGGIVGGGVGIDVKELSVVRRRSQKL